MVAEVVHGAPYRFTDPARFSFAHGGKDRHPFPVPIKVYDETIRVLKSAVSKARLGREEELGALKRLDEQARLLEHHASGPLVEELISEERESSHLNGGRSVFGWEQPSAAHADSTPARPQRPEVRSLRIGPELTERRQKELPSFSSSERLSARHRAE
jgi:hypothetical protein